MIKFACVVCLLCASLAEAQPSTQRCQTVYLPDLNPIEGQQTTQIMTGFAVPPGWTQPAGAFYPVNLHSTVGGLVNISQSVGEPWAKERYFSGVTSISLVFWGSKFDPALEGHMTLQPYKVLPNSAPPGVEPTWAFYRFPAPITDPKAVNFAFSTPILLGQDWNWSAQNDLAYTVWLEYGQAEVMICR